MQIQVLGTGCTTCKNLFEITKEAVQELNIECKVEYITDINKIIEMGILTPPVLAVNGKAVMNGFTKDIERIKELIANSKDNPDDNKVEDTDGCNCRSGCC